MALYAPLIADRSRWDVSSSRKVVLLPRENISTAVLAMSSSATNTQAQFVMVSGCDLRLASSADCKPTAFAEAR